VLTPVCAVAHIADLSLGFPGIAPGAGIAPTRLTIIAPSVVAQDVESVLQVGGVLGLEIRPQIRGDTCRYLLFRASQRLFQRRKISPTA